MKDKSVYQLMNELNTHSIFVRMWWLCWRAMGHSLYRWNVIENTSLKVRTGKNLPIWVQPQKTYQKVICLTGFGHSGSGAVADLLAEYKTATVLSFVDKNGSKRTCAQSSGEVDFLRGQSGLFSFENYIKSGCGYADDLHVRLLIQLFMYSVFRYGGIYNDKFVQLARKFISKLLDYTCETGSGYDFSPELASLGCSNSCVFWGENKNKLYYLRKLSEGEFRSIAHEFVADFLRTIDSNGNIVLDQAVCDGTGDIKKYEDYLGPIRLVAVIRDPRDVYVTGRKLHENWIPENVESFIKWYRQRVSPYLDLRHNHFRLLRFEELVLNYDNSVDEIESFLGLRKEDHTNAKNYFDPKVSRKNIGIYETFSGSEAIKRIKTELSDYCYEL